VKAACGIGIHHVLLKVGKPKFSAAIWGLWSSVSELLFAALFLWKFEIWSPSEVVLFGLGAGVAEMLVITLSILFESKIKRGEKEKKEDETEWQYGYWHTVYERFFAMVGHVGSRFLIWIGIVQAEILPVIFCVMTFTLVDGVAAYLQETGYDFENPKKLFRFLHFNAAISILEIILCLIFFYY
jgi:hypothetical protein